jgi:chemotaxis protein methyltransferase CheR
MSLGVQEFGFVADLVRREAAIVLTTGKEYLVETRLAPLARAAGAPGVADFVRGVQASGTARQRRAIVEALTTNETSWFRDAGVFEALRTEILPGLLESRGPVRPVRVWSAAASTGQEAYSVAMLMGEIAPGRRADILATTRRGAGGTPSSPSIGVCPHGSWPSISDAAAWSGSWTPNCGGASRSSC